VPPRTQPRGAKMVRLVGCCEVPVVAATEGRTLEAGDVDAGLVKSGGAGFYADNFGVAQPLAEPSC
jgi:hypothetical protein